MKDSDSAKSKIEQLVKAYTERYADEFLLFQEAIKAKRTLSKDEFFQLEGTEMRPLFETPEKLYASFVLGLDEDELIWFKTNEGGRWFASSFPAFALPTFI